MASVPPFRYTLTASPDGEVWDHTDDTHKFSTFGWRTTNKENAYNNQTRIGNWNERNFGLDEIQKQHQPKSQFGHYFESTQKAMMSSISKPEYDDKIKYLLRKEATAFPGHQPELCNDYTKSLINDMYQSNYSLNYRPLQHQADEAGQSTEDTVEEAHHFKRHNEGSKLVAAICASPAVAFSGWRFNEGRSLTCYPALAIQLNGNYKYSTEAVVVDGNMVTSQGPGTAFAFGMKLLELLNGDKARDKIASDMLYGS